MIPERITPIRPLLFTRLRLFLGGQAEFVDEVFGHELDALYVELTKLRDHHAPEAEVEQAKAEIVHLVNARRDITTGLLDDRMEFLKVRVYRGGQADTLRSVLLGEQETLLELLHEARATGKTEDDPEIETLRTHLHYLVNVLKELGQAQIDLAGPDTDPR